MHKIIVGLIICFFLIVLTGCIDESDKLSTTQTRLEGGETLKVVEFDGHEYIILRVGSGICHKADCKFCEE